MHTNANRRGTSLVEVVIGLTLFTSFATGVFLALKASAGSYRTETSVAHLDFLARKTLDDLEERLRAADHGSLLPPPVAAPASTSTLDYQSARGYAGGAVTWGPTERVVLEPDTTDAANGLDDDGDGLVDEGRLMWIENPALAGARRSALCANVSASQLGEIAGNGLDDNGNELVDEAGFCLQSVGDRLIVHLTLECLDSQGRVIRHRASRTVTPRNTPEE